jgi:hypothetical protein
MALQGNLENAKDFDEGKSHTRYFKKRLQNSSIETYF